MKLRNLLSILLLAMWLPSIAYAELEALFFSGQPGLTVDANGDGIVDENDGMVTAMYDPDTDVIVFQADQIIGGGVVIYQITEQFDTQVLQEIAQFPLDGDAQFINSRPSNEFVTLFLDTVSFTPINQAANALLQKILGSIK